MVIKRVMAYGLKEKEVLKALCKMKCGKMARLDGNGVELLKRVDDSTVNWIGRISENVWLKVRCLRTRGKPRQCIYIEGKGDKGECSKYRVTSL